MAVVIAAVVIGVIAACWVMLVTASENAYRGCSVRCAQFEGGWVAGGGRQVYLVFWGGQPGMQRPGFNG
jgi:hypothetical protein